MQEQTKSGMRMAPTTKFLIYLIGGQNALKNPVFLRKNYVIFAQVALRGFM